MATTTHRTRDRNGDPITVTVPDDLDGRQAPRPARRTAAKAVAEHNAVTLALLEELATLLPEAGPGANWGHAGTAEHVRQRVAELVANMKGEG